MLIDLLSQDPEISKFVCLTCEENGFGVTIDAALERDHLLIIKVDDYYNSFSGVRPASPDCLIITKCKDGGFNIYIIELKDISSQGGFSIRNIKEKFGTCIYDFMSNVLNKYFYREDIKIKKLELIFVTDPYDQAHEVDNMRKSKNTKMDALLALSAGMPFRFDARLWSIQHAWRNPLITVC